MGFSKRKVLSRLSPESEYDSDVLWDCEGWLNLGQEARRYVNALPQRKAYRILKFSSMYHLT
jgi:hypothetical protein